MTPFYCPFFRSKPSTFLLALRINSNTVTYLHGPTASVQEMDREDFIRVWSGIALLPRFERWQCLIYSAIGFALGLFFLVGRELYQFRRGYPQKSVQLRIAKSMSILLFIMFTQSNFGNPAYSNIPLDVQEKITHNVQAMSSLQLDYIEIGDWTNGVVTIVSNHESYDGGRIYRRSKDTIEGGKPCTNDNDWSFDGKFVWAGTPDIKDKEARGCPAKLVKWGCVYTTARTYTANMFQSSYLECAGFHVPYSRSEISQSGQSAFIDSLVLHYLKESDATTVERTSNSVNVTVRIPDPALTRARQTDAQKEIAFFKSVSLSEQDIRKQIEVLKRMQELVPTRTVTFFLDPVRGYAVAQRREWTAAGQLILQVQPSRWEYHESNGIWLPTECVITYYAEPDVLLQFSDKPCGTTTVKLQSIALGAQRGVEFNLAKRAEYKKTGTVIVDITDPDADTQPARQITYTIAAGGTQLWESAAYASHEMSRGKQYFWVCMLLIAFGSPIAVILFKRKS